MTINHSIVEVRGLREPERSTKETAKIEQTFPRLVEWVISGVRTEARGVDRKATRPRRSRYQPETPPSMVISDPVV
jgi:hypothetical protein